ncbi:uncharacterized protein LOC132299241 isoform X2 [Cornus florida]|uniref:uncharacterized protein LOC132299241 isoform X2 n=1 Tax=Cornus florida TaxID=4283 RepID=UPI00289F4D09|nr:uncharacterized protein LOC132299241 isoform X2 [Cornus florida]
MPRASLPSHVAFQLQLSRQKMSSSLEIHCLAAETLSRTIQFRETGLYEKVGGYQTRITPGRQCHLDKMLSHMLCKPCRQFVNDSVSEMISQHRLHNSSYTTCHNFPTPMFVKNKMFVTIFVAGVPIDFKNF